MATQSVFEQAGFQFPQSLAERYQPKTISAFVGLEKAKRIMAKFVENPYPSAWLFVGPSGTGKNQHGTSNLQRYRWRTSPHPQPVLRSRDSQVCD